ncbi:ABC transporter permease [Streptomyces actuosus]|uniref:Transport permease protein n=1 Tax=Streptomyces actuosus TaxID=1885 RepID=A0ABS2VYA9_STRAS|nr:ABC transporter permease [Streptomyces actuosus]MBN0048029.1 ABC transporter permease [Streptomyces actuosus]
MTPQPVNDALAVFQRSLRYTVRNPAWVAVGLIQPTLYLVFFGPLLLKLSQGPGFDHADSWSVFVPGLLVQQAMFSCIFVGIGILNERRAGVLDRMRVSPAHKTALLAGRVARDVVVLLVQASVLVLGAVAVGLRASLPGVLLAVLLVGVLAAGMSSLSYGLALRMGQEEAYSGVLNAVTLPVLLLSGILLPMSLAPTWLAWLSRINPLTHVVTAERHLFAGDLDSGRVLLGAGLAVLLVLVAGRFGIRAMQDTAR